MAKLTKADLERATPDKKWSDDKIISFLMQAKGMTEVRARAFLRGWKQVS